MRKVHLTAIAVGIGLALAGLPATAEPFEFPNSQSEFYEAGEAFAQCSAHLAFAAQVARAQQLPSSATNFDNVERGWSLAGMVLLAEGLDPSRQPGVEQLFRDMQTAKIEQLRAWREVDPDGYNTRLLAEFETECVPWTEVQKAIITAMRRATPPR